MFVIDSLLTSGIKFVLDKVATVVDREMNDPDRWRTALLELQMKLENGEISEDEFLAQEKDILAELRRLRPEISGMAAGANEITGVSITTDTDDEE